MDDELEWPDRLFCLHPIVKTFGDMITYPERKEYVLIDRVLELEEKLARITDKVYLE